jgi:hypothetical protein
MPAKSKKDPCLAPPGRTPPERPSASLEARSNERMALSRISYPAGSR